MLHPPTGSDPVGFLFMFDKELKICDAFKSAKIIVI